MASSGDDRGDLDCLIEVLSNELKMFDAKSVLEELKQEAADKRKRRYRKSKIDRYALEVLQLHNEGASYSLIIAWLKKQHIHIKSRSTIKRWLDNHQ